MYRRGWLDREIYENGFKCYWILKTIGYHLISLDWIEYMQAVLDCDQKWGSTMISWRYIICPVMCAYDCARSFQMIVSHLIRTYWSPMLPMWGTGRAWLSIGAPNASSSLSLFASWASNVVGLVLVYLRGSPATAHLTSHYRTVPGAGMNKKPVTW